MKMVESSVPKLAGHFEEEWHRGQPCYHTERDHGRQGDVIQESQQRAPTPVRVSIPAPMPDESVDARVIIRANAPGFNSRPGIVARLAPTWEVLEQLIEQACDLYDWIALLWAASGEAPAKERLANVNYRRALLPISECKNVFWTRVNSGISALCQPTCPWERGAILVAHTGYASLALSRDLRAFISRT